MNVTPTYDVRLNQIRSELEGLDAEQVDRAPDSIRARVLTERRTLLARHRNELLANREPLLKTSR